MQIIPFPDFVRRFHSGEEFVIFDTETTGLNTFHDDIVEVAGVIWKKGAALQKFEELIRVNPNKITQGAWDIHKIPKEEIEKARKVEDVLTDFLSFAGNRSLVAHNAKFDYDILNSNLVRSGQKPYQNDFTACTLQYAKEQMLPGRLHELATHYKVAFEQSSLHRAMADVELLNKILDKIMAEHEPSDMQYSLII